MVREKYPPTETFLPDRFTLPKLRAAAADCRGCPLYLGATQTVFGEGPRDARIMLMGEQPGDREDVEGHPFVGPAGKLLDRALEEAGLARGAVYVTNAAKHFHFETRGKFRLQRSGQGDRAQHCAGAHRDAAPICGPARARRGGARGELPAAGHRPQARRETYEAGTAENPLTNHSIVNHCTSTRRFCAAVGLAGGFFPAATHGFDARLVDLRKFRAATRR